MSRSQVNHSRSRGVVTSALFAISLLIASASSAASDTTKPFTGNTQNPCTGDSITYTGQEHMVNNNRTANDGSLFINYMDQMTGKGPGTPSGVQYNVGITSKQNGKFPPGPVIFRSRTKVNSNGPTDNFFETFFFRFNQDGTPGNTSFESDCRG